MSRSVVHEATLVLAPPVVQRTFRLVADASITYRLLRNKRVNRKQRTTMILATLSSLAGTDADAQWLVDAGYMAESFLLEWAEYQAS